MVQTLCSKIGVQPSVLDSAMLSPGADELIRFKVTRAINRGQSRWFRDPSATLVTCYLLLSFLLISNRTPTVLQTPCQHSP